MAMVLETRGPLGPGGACDASVPGFRALEVLPSRLDPEELLRGLGRGPPGAADAAEKGGVGAGSSWEIEMGLKWGILWECP